ncbi:MAG: hypothetical protein KDD99_17245 [Bacteroidetes bacterium]|nr:hypothetical protein [Bacteroidota bacterium]
MKKISRKEFLKTSSLVAAVAAFNPPNLFGKLSIVTDSIDEWMLNRLVKANDQSAERFLQSISAPQRWQYYRNLSEAFSVFTAAFSHPKSVYYESNDVLKASDTIIDQLLGLQYPNGTLDSGGNRKSPPDTAFLLEALYPSALILRKNETKETASVKAKLDKFLLAAGEGIRTGGVHTPNHRWEISSVLAKLYHLYGDKKYVTRIDEWLAEGIYQNSDGNYPERSRNYAVVENEAFMVIGEILNRPEFFDIVSKNLTSTYYYMEPDGELVSLDSRRQDQFRPILSWKTYLPYRYMAIHENSDFFASIAREIESFDGFDRNILSRSLPHFMGSEILQKEMPKGQTLPTTFTKHFKDSDLVRIKRGNITVSIFGGNDLPLTVASGRSCNPTFFTFRKGSAILEYARLSTSFFNTGYVRSEGLKKEGNTYTLHEKKEAYYYHPMPEKKRNKKGDYKLSPSLDGRFWSKMDFESRPKTTLELESKIIIEEVDNSFRMNIEVNGAENVEVTLDLCFKDGGTFEDVLQGQNEKDFFLEGGMAKYIVGGDTIEVGPGKYEHERIRGLDGEVYSTHFGSIKGEGQHLYITGIVPFKHSITIK